MSGTGKSSALAELARRGFRTVDTDDPGWKIGELWDENKIARLLAAEGPTLFVAGTVENQGRFYDRFDEVVLLTVPVDVALERIGRRTTNDYGKSAGEVELIREHFASVEPLLRATATRELDGTRPLDEVVAALFELVR